LQILAIVSSKVSSLHDLKLLACTFLDDLELGECAVTAADPANDFAVGQQGSLCIPDLSLLTNLSHLDVSLASSDVWVFDAGWLYKMASIESLACTVHGALLFDNRLTQLSRLKDLQLSSKNSTDARREIRCHAIEWEALHHLTHLSFAGPSSFDESILKITLIDKLRLVSLSGLRPTDNFTVTYLAMLTHRSAVHRPRVVFEM